MSNDILNGDLCKKAILIPYFLLVSKHDFIKCVDFTSIAASNTASDNITKKITRRIFNTYLLYSCAHFVVKIDEKFSHNGGF